MVLRQFTPLTAGSKNLQQALQYHKKHDEISDEAGRFIANTNMGLVHGLLGDWQRAMEHHKKVCILLMCFRALEVSWSLLITHSLADFIVTVPIPIESMGMAFIIMFMI